MGSNRVAKKLISKLKQSLKVRSTGGLRLISLFRWRTVRDSNPRYPYEYASLAGMWFQPTHPTVHKVFVMGL